jgi:hypothetical protein
VDRFVLATIEEEQMRGLLIASALISGQLSAADFRVANFGESCVGITEREEALGSAPIAWNPSRPELIAFRGAEFDREVSILYLCPKGALFTGNYFLKNENLDDALKTLRFIYDKLFSERGVPYFDTTPWQADADPRGVQPDPRKYMVTWRDAHVRTTIMVMPADRSEKAWHVFIVVGQDKPD